MRINISRVEERIALLNQIGLEESGGNTRLAFTSEDKRARDLLASWLEDAGMQVVTDEAGNIIARLAGRVADHAPIIIGSHLDTVPDGGKYDGVLGCLAGLECVEVLQEAGYELDHPLEIIVFADEEGSRFGTVLLGSRAMVGTLQLAELRRAHDKAGVSAYEAMREFGLQPDRIANAKRTGEDIAAYFELHVEQGAVLDSEKIDIGVVSGIVGIKRSEIEVIGEANHAGTTPFSLRKDALLAAAEMIIAVREVTESLGNEATVATVGQLQVLPGAVNVVPGVVRYMLEIRDTDATLMQRIEQAIRERLREIASIHNTKIKITPITDVAPVPLDLQLQKIIGEAAATLQIPYKIMPSGAGHDAQSMAGICPTGMIFVPSEKGISHSPHERTKAEAIRMGIKVLLQSLIKLDQK